MRSLWAINGSHRSIIHQFIRFPLWRRPSFINIQFWAAWWVCVNNGSVRSFRANNGFPVLSYFSACELRGLWLSCLVFPQAFWCSRRKRWWRPYAASRDQIHHWSRLCCGSFFNWFFLCSFRHHFRTLCRTEIANVKLTEKMIPFATCEISLG